MGIYKGERGAGRLSRRGRKKSKGVKEGVKRKRETGGKRGGEEKEGGGRELNEGKRGGEGGEAGEQDGWRGLERKGRTERR